MTIDDDDPNTLTIDPDETKIDLITRDQATWTRKKKLMTAELTTISPGSLLFNALSIAGQELARLQQLSVNGDLSGADFKKYSILIQALCKLSEESRLNKSQSHLEGKTDQEINLLVTKAIESLKDE